ncbi:NAD(P)-binding protein [Trichoderma citrinoviride]|uniref:NAD(P)-binding protein n=1 Tax=Trichoderma citrinoviride TaxID=58853 RepID=A0A2T4AYF1_9HYPO|nr:NAD(P)-binding protein [Trichoderma citrinoviride]PTB62093.1 NAD(P)-binding protein [Trichoderma citrinoviride]
MGIAIIGGGLFPAVLTCDLIHLAAIYSRSLKAAQETASLVPDSVPKPDLYSEDSGAGKAFQDLLKRDDISAVIIALPIPIQPSFIEAALSAGKHVLAEKPIAKDVPTAQALIANARRINSETKATFAVAENFRFYPSFTHAASEAAKLGKVHNFTVRVLFRIQPDSKWYNTAWRKTPDYQGGFLLDGGVHFAAATRLLLAGDENTPDTVQAFTALTCEHLQPIDTVNAIIKTKSGAAGVFQQSAGSLLQAFEWNFSYDKGTVKVVGETVTVQPAGGEEQVKKFDRTNGVSEEVAAWAQSLVDGKVNPLQTPEQALADLEFLEKMFTSGDKNGSTQKYEFL